MKLAIVSIPKQNSKRPRVPVHVRVFVAVEGRGCKCVCMWNSTNVCLWRPEDNLECCSLGASLFWEVVSYWPIA